MKYCRDHELHFEGGGNCPYCVQRVYPLRALRAVRDFANQPWPHTSDVPTWRPTIKYSEVVRRLGRELVEMEADRLSRCVDLELRGRDLRRRAKVARIDLQALNRAARVLAGFPEERARLTKQAASYLQVMEDDGVDW